MGCVDHGQKGYGLGYGSLSLHGKKARAHRAVYCKHHGLVAEDIVGLVIRHTCDNARCINPDHLVLGTQQDNMDDKCLRGRHPKGVQHHKAILSVDDVAFIRANYVRYSKEWGTTALARMLGVHYTSVHKVVRGTTWSHS